MMVRVEIIFVAMLLVAVVSGASERSRKQGNAVASTPDERTSRAAGSPRMQEKSTWQQERKTPQTVGEPALPEGMTLKEVLDDAGSPPPKDYPKPVPDNAWYAFTLFEQLEYRIQEEGRDALGWDAQGWIGYDYDKFWWKSEGEAIFEGRDAGESETDLLYSRLITPFWNVQGGVQYANEWESSDYGDTWAGVFALQGLAPGMFEVDAALYVSEDADVTAEVEGEYDLRVTQRLVLQPRVELSFAAQDIPEKRLGAGLADAVLGLRLRYEMKRELAPYIGVRYRFLVGETGNLAESVGEDTEELFFLTGMRFAF